MVELFRKATRIFKTLCLDWALSFQAEKSHISGSYYYYYKIYNLKNIIYLHSTADEAYLKLNAYCHP